MFNIKLYNLYSWYSEVKNFRDLLKTFEVFEIHVFDPGLKTFEVFEIHDLESFWTSLYYASNL